MNLPIEVIVIFVLMGFFILWELIAFITKKIKLWRYKPENDKGRRAEENRRSGFQRPVLPTVDKRLKLLPTASFSQPTTRADAIRQIKHSIGEIGGSDRKVLRSDGEIKHPFFRRD